MVPGSMWLSIWGLGGEVGGGVSSGQGTQSWAPSELGEQDITSFSIKDNLVTSRQKNK